MMSSRISRALLLCGLLALMALAGALVSQFVFGLPPCELCLYQRWPYAAVFLLALPAALLVKSVRGARRVLLLLAAVFLLDAGIAGYHAGVEWEIFEGLDTCSAGELPPGVSLEEVRQQLMEASIVSCKDPMFVFLGLSMAAWNALYALGCAGLSGVILRRRMV